MYYIIYETKNLINNKKYRGMHSTKNINDTYLGSGNLISKAIKKYGKNNFSREILEICSSFEEMCQKEKIYVSEEWISNNDVYNLRVGGIGNSKGSIPWNKNIKGVQEAWNKGLELTSQTEESNLKRSNTLKEKYSKEQHHSKGKKIKHVIWNKGKSSWNKGIEMKKIQCPYCEKYADIGNLKRWHLDNCKLKKY